MMVGALLVAVALSAHAEDAGPCLAGTTVLSDRLEITITGDSRLLQRHTWQAEIGDPGACADGLPVPPDLDGARDGEAVVRGDRLLIPGNLPAGTTVTLTRTRAGTDGPFSGTYASPEGLRIFAGEIVIDAPGAARLGVWTDDHARLVEPDPRRRSVRITWAPDHHGPRQVAWSTWRSWGQAGDALSRAVERKLARRDALPGFGDPPDPSALEAVPSDRRLLVALIEEAVRKVEVAPGNLGRFAWARPAAEVAAAGRGSAAERALVLISTIRAADLEAHAAVVRAASDVAVPGVLPAPDLYDRPAVVVTLGDEALWIDPAAAPGDPAVLAVTLRGGTGFVSGHLPRPLDDRSGPDGAVIVETELELDAAGNGIAVARVRAEGAGTHALRDWLAPLTARERAEAWHDLLRAGRPGARSPRIAASGIDDPGRTPEVRVVLQIPGALRALDDGGFEGAVPPFLGPALAARLPANLEVRETLTVKTPAGTRFAVARPAPDVVTGPASVVRDLALDGNTATLRTDALVPHRRPSAIEADAARLALHAAGAVDGPWVLVLPDGQTSVRGRVALPLEPLERDVLGVLLDPEGSAKALERLVLKQPLDDILRAMRSLAPPGDAAPWRALFEALPTAADRFAVIYAMEDHGLTRDGWQLAGHLTRSGDPAVAVEALVAVARLQGRKPDARKDAAGRDAWIEPLKLLLEARKRWAETGASWEHPLVAGPLAVQLTIDGKLDEAAPLVDALGDAPLDRAIRLRWEAAKGVAGIDQVRRLAEEADPEVLGHLAAAALALGQPLDARDLALQAARRDHRDTERWMAATDAALAAGDLPTALYAARKASDRDPVANDTGVALQLLGTLAGDVAAAALATERCDYQALIDELPAPFETIWTVTQPQHELAVLRAYDGATRADPERLARRAELLREAGRLDEAARDGMLLASEHGRRAELARHHAATARLWTTDPSSELDRLSYEPAVRSARMEWALVVGASSAANDAAVLGSSDPRAEALKLAARDPARLAAEHGWTASADPEVSAPEGLVTNRLLEGLEGVEAWSDPVAGQALVVTAAEHGLPPPLSVLFVPGPVLDRDDDGTVLRRWDGGAAPVYVADRVDGDVRRFGIGWSPAAARQAVARGGSPPPDEAAPEAP